MLRRRQCQDACKLLRLRQSSSTVGVSCFGSRKSGKLGISFIETTMGILSIDSKTTMKSYAKLAVANIQKCLKASISPMGKSVSLRCSSRSRRRKSSVRSRSYRTLLVDPTLLPCWMLLGILRYVGVFLSMLPSDKHVVISSPRLQL